MASSSTLGQFALHERWPGWTQRNPSWADIWLGPTILQNWGGIGRPAPHGLNVYWDSPAQLDKHWIIRSGARVDASFAGMDNKLHTWLPTKQHRRDKKQGFGSWSHFDSSGDKIAQLPFLLRAVSGTNIEVAMEALQTLHEHLYHQDTIAGGVSLVLPVLAELLARNLTDLRGSIHAFLALAEMPHVSKILPGFERPLQEDTDVQVTYRPPEWRVLPNEITAWVPMSDGKPHGRVKRALERVVLDHQQPFSDQGKVGWQNDLQVNGEFFQIETYDHGVKNGLTQICINDVVIQRGELEPGGRQNQGHPIGTWEGWWPNGSVRFAAQYVNGKREGLVRTYSPTGSILTEASYSKNKRVGEWQQWSTSGTLLTKGQFTGNRPRGEWHGFYPEGLPRFQGSFRDGLRFGTWTYWAPDGKQRELEHDYD